MVRIFFLNGLVITIILFSSSCGTYPNPSRTYHSINRALWKFTPEYYLLKSKLSDETKFVNKILKNPDLIQEFIQKSTYYDEELLDINIWFKTSKDDDFELLSQLLEKNARIINFGYVDLLVHKDKQKYSDCKVVIVSADYYFIDFYFKEFENKNRLIYIGVIENNFNFE
jgi:hypothetical protein